jgi:hypothetical protein
LLKGTRLAFVRARSGVSVAAAATQGCTDRQTFPADMRIIASSAPPPFS